MILVTRINGVEQFYINESHIEFMEETPNTVLSMKSGKKVVVLESAQEIIGLMDEAWRKRNSGLSEAPRTDNC